MNGDSREGGIWVCRWWTREKARGRVKQDDDRSPREVLEKVEVPRKRSTTVLVQTRYQR